MDMTIRTMNPTGIPMSEISLNDAALYRLMTWLSPGFPIGAYAYSHGLDWSVENGDVQDMDSLALWLEDLCRHGGGRSDAIFFQHGWTRARSNSEDLVELNDLAIALSPSRERRMESVSQGRAFMIAIAPSWPWRGAPDIAMFNDADIAYPIAVAMAAAGHGVALRPALHAYLHAFIANLISAGLRLIPLGQTEGQHLLARLEATIGALTDEALAATLDDLGGAAFLADIASMRHETQYTRLFRS
ncbi:MAG: urease accessory protein [Alphaproteobacteria bacterium]|jgi:urease accessory protein